MKAKRSAAAATLAIIAVGAVLGLAGPLEADGAETDEADDRW
ncbi:MAG: hypothetical protein ACT4QF_00075 [Sporichthyaceae bacterium]